MQETINKIRFWSLNICFSVFFLNYKSVEPIEDQRHSTLCLRAPNYGRLCCDAEIQQNSPACALDLTFECRPGFVYRHSRSTWALNEDPRSNLCATRAHSSRAAPVIRGGVRRKHNLSDSCLINNPAEGRRAPTPTAHPLHGVTGKAIASQTRCEKYRPCFISTRHHLSWLLMLQAVMFLFFFLNINFQTFNLKGPVCTYFP